MPAAPPDSDRRVGVPAGLMLALLSCLAPARAAVAPPDLLLTDHDLGGALPAGPPPAPETVLVGGALAVLSRDPDTGLPRSLHAWGRPLSAASAEPPAAAARAFLRAHPDLFLLAPDEIDDLVVARDYPTGTHFHVVWLVQALAGTLVDRADLRFALDRERRVVWTAAGRIQPGLAAAGPVRLGPGEAVARAAAALGVDLAGPPRPLSPASSRVQRFALDGTASPATAEPALHALGGAAVRAYRVFLEDAGEDGQVWEVLIDAGAGRVLARHGLTRYANEGLVFPGESPDEAAAARAAFGYRWPSTAGWTVPAPWGLYAFSIGNNADVKEDLARDNELGIGSRADGGPLQEFFFPFRDAFRRSTAASDAARAADAVQDRDAGITNVFHWVNLLHDEFHGLGFDEAAGNFQADNFGRGGCGRDPVYADVLDGALPPSGSPSLNNANFSTPPEPVDCQGGPFEPRMNLFLWASGCDPFRTRCDVLRDAAFDADILVHELAHGLTTRLVGGPSASCLHGVQAGAMGEGWSDFYAASRFDDAVVAEYVSGDAGRGIRNHAMDANPRTYADLCGIAGRCQVHDDGEIWASALWDLRRLVGRTVAEQLVTDGLKLTPCTPSFVDGRDAILLADRLRYGGAHACAVWAAFVARGLGFDARGDNTSHRVADRVFVDPACSGEAYLRYRSHRMDDQAGGDGDGLWALGETLSVEVEIDNLLGASDAASVSVTLSSPTPGVQVLTPTRAYPAVARGQAAWPTAPFLVRLDPGYVCGAALDLVARIDWAPGRSRADAFSESGGSVPGVLLGGSDAEGVPLALSGPVGVSARHNHTPGGARSYHTLAGCYAGDDPTCLGPCNDTCGAIELGTAALPVDQAAWVSFWSSYNDEVGWDGVVVEASLDGVAWEPVDTVAYPGVAGGSLAGCRPGTPQPAINGPPGNDRLVPWTLFAGDLSRWGGRTVQVRLRSHHDDCLYFEGAYLDDLELRVRECRSVPFVALYLAGRANDDTLDPGCSDGDLRPDPGETVELVARIANAGSATATGVMARLVSSHPALSVLGPPVAIGSLAPGQGADATFRYAVAAGGVSCFEPAGLALEVTADGGHAQTLDWAEDLRTDPGTGSFRDRFEGSSLPWTASLGPQGSASDFSLQRLDCRSGAGAFWATQRGLEPTVCSTGEPDYSADSDSLLTSPPGAIDLGSPGQRLRALSWSSAGFATTVEQGLVEVAVDHDGDGTFTTVSSSPNGHFDLDPAGARHLVDLQANPAGAPLPAAATSRTPGLRFRFRAGAADPGPGAATGGMIVDDVELTWDLCDVRACAPGRVPGPGPASPREAAGTAVEAPR